MKQIYRYNFTCTINITSVVVNKISNQFSKTVAKLTVMAIVLAVLLIMCTCYLCVLICYLARSHKQDSKINGKPPPSYSDIIRADKELPPTYYIDLFPDDAATELLDET